MRNERMYQELVTLITTDAASRKETRIADLLAGRLSGMGFTVTRDNAGETFGGECGNLFAVREGELSGSLLLCSHMDRMPKGLGIKPVERDGVLYSDGTTILAADDVSGIAAILEGIRRVLEKHQPLPRLEICFTVGEEIGMCGSRAMDLSQIKSTMGYIFDSPGGTGRFVVGAPGHYRLGADIQGRAAHAGNEPEKGINATKIVCDILSTLKQGRLDVDSTSNFPEITTASAGSNSVCDFASFRGEARSRDRQKLLDYVAYFEKHCRDIARANDAGVKLYSSATFLPFKVSEEEPVCQMAKAACEKLGLTATFEMGGGGMDANIFNNNGITTIGVATGYTKNHTLQEQLVLEDFFKSGELAETLIETYAASCES